MNRRERRRREKLSRTAGRVEAEAVPGDAPSVLLRRAVEFHQAGHIDEARGLCRQILAVEPKHPDALNLNAMISCQSGNVREGIKQFKAALAERPEFVEARNNLGNAFKALGRFEEAEKAYRQALEINPDYADAHYNLGVLMETAGRRTEAEAAYRRAVKLRPDFAAAHLALGNVAKSLGRLDEAVVAYRRAVALGPDLADAHNNLGTALQELGEHEAAEGAYRKATALDPAHADASYNLGVVLQETERFEEAMAAYADALRAAPGHTGAHVNRGYALKKLGRLDEAVDAYRRAIDLAPDYDKARVNLGDALLERGEPEAALAVCDAYLRDYPGNTSVLAFKAIVLDELGERARTRHLVDFGRLVRPTQFSTAAGFDSLADFNGALSRHVLDHPSLTLAPASHATRLGKHSGELLVEPKGPMAVFEGMLRGAVEEYLAALTPEASHPFLANAPRRFGLSAWSIVLEGHGYQVPHIHPAAWLSSVYYVKVPDIVEAPGRGHAGWIEFGRPAADFQCTVEPELRLFQPGEGLLLLFPSYFHHRTVPFESPQTRISISTDVLRET
ncbi:MAG: tetratricopeptide repeat protein [Rhodospirillales bacterium]|jgi:tetratricopeptide (TPR) repeat protein|nr:tetratricopeptide repeat protein [Rhodospirillales bacterium]